MAVRDYIAHADDPAVGRAARRLSPLESRGVRGGLCYFANVLAGPPERWLEAWRKARWRGMAELLLISAATRTLQQAWRGQPGVGMRLRGLLGRRSQLTAHDPLVAKLAEAFVDALEFAAAGMRPRWCPYGHLYFSRGLRGRDKGCCKVHTPLRNREAVRNWRRRQGAGGKSGRSLSTRRKVGTNLAPVVAQKGATGRNNAKRRKG